MSLPTLLLFIIASILASLLAWKIHLLSPRREGLYNSLLLILSPAGLILCMYAGESLLIITSLTILIIIKGGGILLLEEKINKTLN